jgi:hypothetical protein
MYPGSITKRLQFQLRTVFWLMLCLAIGLGAYRLGFDTGFREGSGRRRPAIYTKVYDVGHLVRMKRVGGEVVPDCDILIEQIRKNVLPDTWVEHGGQASIRFFPANRALIVSHHYVGQERVSKYLEARLGRYPRFQSQ